MLPPVKNIFEIDSKEQFATLALQTFRFQADCCEVYRDYLNLLGVDPVKIETVEEIPFLPIELFKTHRVYSCNHPAQHIFTSSATTGMVPAKHHIADVGLYEESFIRAFRLFMGDPECYTILALLPSYVERQGSSLVYMVDKLMQLSGAQENGYYLYNHQELFQQLSLLRDRGTHTLLFGVSFALLDFVEKHAIDFPDLKVIETGGMKGRGLTLPRMELHQKLRQGFGTIHIHSEYGMAELLSQAYSIAKAYFITPPWMDVYIRDLYDPFRYLPDGQQGGVNVVDLANRYSCSFIETQDMGIRHSGGSFELLGRIPFSELRGCNLLIE